jgi:hypothetical protein
VSWVEVWEGWVEVFRTGTAQALLHAFFGELRPSVITLGTMR